MKKSLLAAVAVVAMASVDAGATVRPYIGTSNLSNPFNNAVIGFDLGTNFRVEGDFGYNTSKADGDDRSTTTKFGAFGFYDFNEKGQVVTPFVGLGLTYNSYKYGNSEANSTGLQGQVGIAKEVIKDFVLSAALKVGFASSDNGGSSVDSNSFGVGLGARYVL